MRGRLRRKEPVAESVIGGNVPAQQLEGIPSARESWVLGQIDLAHSTGADKPLGLYPANCSPGPNMRKSYPERLVGPETMASQPRPCNSGGHRWLFSPGDGPTRVADMCPPGRERPAHRRFDAPQTEQLSSAAVWRSVDGRRIRGSASGSCWWRSAATPTVLNWLLSRRPAIR